MSTLLTPNPEAGRFVERARDLRAQSLRRAILRALDYLPRRLRAGRA